jgi:ATP-dependent protease ClpP protease subunit
MAQTVYISYYDVINDQKTKAVMAVCANVIAQQNPDRLYFLFSSTGGSVDAGVALFNFLRALPMPLGRDSGDTILIS